MGEIPEHVIIHVPPSSRIRVLRRGFPDPDPAEGDPRSDVTSLGHLEVYKS